jgi:hypothetical protein
LQTIFATLSRCGLPGEAPFFHQGEPTLQTHNPRYAMAELTVNVLTGSEEKTDPSPVRGNRGRFGMTM